MKNKTLIFLALLLSFCTSAQQDTLSLSEIMKRVNSGKSIQDENVEKNTTSRSVKNNAINELLIASVESHIYFVKSYFHLVKGKKTFGQGDLDYFGFSNAIGISINDGIWLPNKSKEPWNGNVDFAEFKDEYKAANKTITLSNLEFKENLKKKVGSKRGRVEINRKKDKCFAKVNEIKEVLSKSTEFAEQGLLILYYGQDSLESIKDLKKEIIYVEPEWNVLNGTLDVLRSPDLIGGVYFKVATAKHGRVILTVAGLVENDYILPLHKSIPSKKIKTEKSENEEVVRKKPKKVLKEIK